MNKLKAALVESFVGTVALGWMFALAIEHFANAFAAPWRMWTTRRIFSSGLRPATNLNFSLQDAAPDLIVGVLLVLIGLALLRWLYFKPIGRAELTSARPDQPIGAPTRLD